MYHNFEVPIPSEPGKIILKRKGESVYILYQYGQEYKPEKKYAIPKRAIIGKVNLDHDGYMFPNENYQEHFPNAIMPEELPEAYRSCALKIGAYSVINKVFNDYKLPAMLKDSFGEDTGLFMDLISYLIVNEDNAGQYYSDFAFNHPLFSKNMRIYSDSKVSRFFKSVSPDQIQDFLNAWNKTRNKKERIYISYDSTNKNCQAGDIDILEYGKLKVDTGNPIFNVAVVYDKTNQIPLLYETYGGSIPDISQFEFVVDKVSDYGYKNIGFLLDRGYFSKKNIRHMEDNNYSYIMMVKGCKALVSSIVKEHQNTFETDRDCVIRAYHTYGKTIKRKLFDDDTSDKYFHIYFRVSKQAAERELLEQNLDKLRLYLDKHLGQAPTLGTIYHEYFELIYDKNGVLVSYNERKEYISERLRLCGYFCIITSEYMTASEALIHYKGRDVSEKLFSSDKTFIGSRSMRVQSAESLSAKLFTEFVALIVRNRIYNLLKATMLRLESKPNFMTVPAALRELEKIEMVRRNNGRYRLDHALSKKQKIILSSFGLGEVDIRSIANDIGKLLAENKSLLYETESESEVIEYGEDEFNDLD